MKIAYTTTFDAQDVHNWSGTPFHMSKALQQMGAEIDYIGSLKRQLPLFFKWKQFWQKQIADQRESPRFNLFAAKAYSLQVAKKLDLNPVDAIVSPLINPIAYLDCKQPIILWTDAVYAALVGFYPPFAYHSASTVQQANAMTAACLSRCRLAIFSSDWAAQSALTFYGTEKTKVKVVPFGANIETYPNFNEIKTIIQRRDKKQIKLLFLAKSWERKGGETVLAVAKALHSAGHAVELTIVGYTPHLNPMPPYVTCLGFISKHTPDGKRQIQQLLADSHFLFVPSRAEAYGIVFCEANAFGVPCLTTYVGGIGTVIKDHINGMTFSLNAAISNYCDYIVNVLQNRQRYENLAYTAYQEFVTRLNWQTAANTVKQLITEVI